MYYILMLILFLISCYVSWSVKYKFRKFAKKAASTGLTGAQAAQILLDANGIRDVKITQIKGTLTDNYHPTKKTLNLSPDVYNKSSISSICVAAHECGHAIQHNTGYSLVMLRKSLVPITNICSTASYFLILLGIFLQISNFAMFGAILYSVIVLFHLVTLPVEINASKRALAQIENLGLLNQSEIKDGKKVLKAAAMTYFIALMTSVIQLLRLLSRANNK